MNLSKTTLTRQQIKLLTRGPKFCPTTKGNFFDFKNDTKNFTKRLITHERYFDSTFKDESIVRKPSKKYITTHNAELTNIINTVNKLCPTEIKMKKNISQGEEKALEEIIKLAKEKVEIKKADKSNTLVIIDKEVYKNKLVLKDHLLSSTYKKSSPDSNEKVFKKLKKIVSKYSNCFTKKETKVVLDADWTDSYFYVLPKIHKCEEIKEAISKQNSEYIHMNFPTTLKGRPINGGPTAVTQGASHLIEKLLNPLVCHMKSYIKDEWDFLRKIPSSVSYPSTLLSCDIVSLYTSIPTDLGLKALDYWITKLGHLIPERFSKECILEMVEFILTNNFTKFEEDLWQQVTGTSMGTKMAPPYACLTIGFLEETILFPTLLPSKFSPSECEKIIAAFFRFMDDGTSLFPISCSKETLLSLLNSMHPSIQYTVEEADSIIEGGVVIQILVFLSILLHLDDKGNIWTNVHYKETNAFDYLSWDSHHPKHIMENIPYCLAKRIIVMSTKEEDMAFNLNHLRKALSDRGYPSKVIEKGIYNASLQGPAPPKSKDILIPLSSMYYSNYSNSTVATVSKQLLKNTKDERLVKAFKDVRIMEAFKQPPNLLRIVSNSAFITADSIRNQVIRPGGLKKCMHPLCNICKLIREGDSFITANGTRWMVKCQANCNSKNVIYYLICKFCEEETYAGKTDKFRNRTNCHCSDIRKGRGGKFDKHVRECAAKHKKELVEPFFEAMIFMVLKDYDSLLSYEAMIHAAGHDTMNAPLAV